MESPTLNGYDNVYIPTTEVNIMAGRRPMFDKYIQRALVAWSIHYPLLAFTSHDIHRFMKETKMQLTQSRGSITVPVIGNRLSFWEKKGWFGLKLISSRPNLYLITEEEE